MHNKIDTADLAKKIVKAISPCCEGKAHTEMVKEVLDAELKTARMVDTWSEKATIILLGMTKRSHVSVYERMNAFVSEQTPVDRFLFEGQVIHLCDDEFLAIEIGALTMTCRSLRFFAHQVDQFGPCNDAIFVVDC